MHAICRVIAGRKSILCGHDLVVGCGWLDFLVLGIWQLSGNRVRPLLFSVSDYRVYQEQCTF